MPQDDIEERLIFYSEMIEDQMEEGLSEEEAVLAVGSVEEIVAQVVAETPLAKIAKERINPKRRLTAGEIVLIVLGSPIWFSLIVAAFVVILALYVSLWAVIISLWTVFISFAACSIACVLACVVHIMGGHSASSAAMLAAGFICAGLSICMLYGCRMSTKIVLIFTKKLVIWIKNFFIKKVDE